MTTVTAELFAIELRNDDGKTVRLTGKRWGGEFVTDDHDHAEEVYAEVTEAVAARNRTGAGYWSDVYVVTADEAVV